MKCSMQLSHGQVYAERLLPDTFCRQCQTWPHSWCLSSSCAGPWQAIHETCCCQEGTRRGVCCRQGIRRNSSSLSTAANPSAPRNVQRRSSSFFLRGSLATIPNDGTRASILTTPTQGIPTLQVSIQGPAIMQSSFRSFLSFRAEPC